MNDPVALGHTNVTDHTSLGSVSSRSETGAYNLKPETYELYVGSRVVAKVDV